jgi:DNA-binding beta-propeller fold protein YncE
MMTNPTATATFRYSHTIGFLANQGRGFNNPVDVAQDSAGILYVVNRAGPELGIRLPYKRVTICTVEEEYLGEFGTGGTEEGQFWWPSALAFDSEDRLYIADEALNRISIFSREGAFLGSWGTAGAAPGQLDRPSGLAFDREDNLYIADSLNHRVQVFTAQGQFLDAWGVYGSRPGRFNLPWGMAVDDGGLVYVADWRNDRVQKLDGDGRFLEQWGGSGSEPGQLHRPAAVAVDRQGLIYVADWGNERVQVLDQDGQVLSELRGDSVDSRWARDYFAANPDEAALRQAADLEPVPMPHPEAARRQSAAVEKLLWGPTAVKVDAQGNIFIVDSCRHRLQVYRKEIAAS